MADISKVYFIQVKESDDRQTVQSKLSRLVKQSQALDCIREKYRVAVKIHFGEKGNTGYVRPEYVRVINDALAKKGASCFLSDTNTLYSGGRTNCADHLKLAYEHGFTPDIVGAAVKIPDDSRKENVAEISVNQKFIHVAKIAKIFADADALVDISHFKGHMMTGFGGALKNLGMGCASREGKMIQHCDVAPVVYLNNCVGCGVCAQVCPVQAITIIKEKSKIDNSKCIGCGSCIAACKYNAMDVNWEQGADIIQEKMIEYTKAALKGKQGKCAFFNFATKITKECDCLAEDDPRIVPDIGIFAATDPVSIDKACLDLIIQASGRDIFKQVHPSRDGMKQLNYAAGLGLGNLQYELIRL